MHFTIGFAPKGVMPWAPGMQSCPCSCGALRAGAWEVLDCNKLLAGEGKETRYLLICFLVRLWNVFANSGPCFNNQTCDYLMLDLLQE